MKDLKIHLVGALITLLAVVAVALFYDPSIGLPPSYFGYESLTEEVFA